MTLARSPQRRAYAACVLTAAAVALCAALMTAVTLAPAPLAVIPLAVLVCIGCPVAMAWSLPNSIAVLRTARAMARTREQAIKTHRANLARLPETEHPLGL